MNNTSKTTFMDEIKNRRSVYAIDNTVVASYEAIEAQLRDAITHVPTAFNSQSGRVILLREADHHRLWNQVKAVLQSILPADQYPASEARINGFDAGYGTILFFEDQGVVEGLQQQFPIYSDNFPIWSQQASGMLQLVVWTALSEAGVGATLQHYNELIHSFVHEAFDVPSSWKLIAQMPFGRPVAAPAEKSFQSIEDRLRIV